MTALRCQRDLLHFYYIKFTTALKMTNTFFKGTLKGTQFHCESSHAFSCEAYT